MIRARLILEPSNRVSHRPAIRIDRVRSSLCIEAFDQRFTRIAKSDLPRIDHEITPGARAGRKEIDKTIECRTKHTCISCEVTRTFRSFSANTARDAKS